MSQKILLVSTDTKNASTLKNHLLKEGYTINECKLINHKIQQSILILAPDIVILHCEIAHSNLIETIKTIQDKTPKPLIIFTDHSDDTMIANSIIAGATAFVIDGIEAHRIRPIIDASTARFTKCQPMQRQQSKIALRPEDRRNIDHAKGLLMKTKGMSEDKAYQFLRKMAMNKNQRISQISQSLLEMAEAP